MKLGGHAGQSGHALLQLLFQVDDMFVIHWFRRQLFRILLNSLFGSGSGEVLQILLQRRDRIVAFSYLGTGVV
jgi:hypothetical protein